MPRCGTLGQSRGAVYRRMEKLGISPAGGEQKEAEGGDANPLPRRPTPSRKRRARGFPRIERSRQQAPSSRSCRQLGIRWSDAVVSFAVGWPSSAKAEALVGVLAGLALLLR